MSAAAPSTPSVRAPTLADPAFNDLIGDEAARVRLGSNAESPADLLYFLARDPSVTVRAAVAMNSRTPAPAEAVLANDADDRVRAVLGRKLALIASGLGDQVQTRLERVVRALLASLVMDEAERVRAMIADVLKDLPNAPPDIIRQLARDTAISVSEPIIRFSPLLSENDLLLLLAAPPCTGTRGAVARRANLSLVTSDAVVATANSGAICDLLNNHSAAIREATLDGLVAKAAGNRLWHEPLVRRPGLSVASMRALSAIVADYLVSLLAERAGLDPEFRAELRARLNNRLAAQPHGVDDPEISIAALIDHVRALEREGKLSENTLTQAVRSGDQHLVVAIMAVTAKVQASVVEYAISLPSAKGLVSLIWRAGFSMGTAVAVQVLLARVPPRGVVNATPNGGFPLSADEMRWQLEFLESATN